LRLCLRVFMTRFCSIALALVCVGAPVRAQEPARPQPIANPRPDQLARGKRLFESQCARCHGISGTGGFGPNLVRPKLRRAPDDEALVRVIQDGIANTAMPGDWSLTEAEVPLVAAYVRSLGSRPSETLPGDPARGKALYEGKGGCAACHIVRGVGSGIGPELTEIGELRGAAYLREALLDPGKTLPDRPVPYEPNAYSGYLLVRAVDGAGRELLGYRLNEDSFTIQLQDAGNRLLSLRKADLRALDKQFGRSPMPGYRGVFKPGEADDLVAYLAGLRGEP
jgi:cytochrome c oxidase cbb3-type subunit III